MRCRLVPVLLALLLAAVASPAAAQEPLTVYSSLPLQGASRPQTTDIVRGMRLALERAGGQAAGRPVRYVSLDDSNRAAGSWTPELVSRNARRAGQDPSAVAYLGEFNSGGSAISVPILNEAGLLQITPSNTAVGLTREGPGAEPGEPEKYYPAGTRTFGRVVPADHVQGQAAGAMVRDAGVKRLLVVHDGEVYGEGLARIARDAARARGVRIVGLRRHSSRGRNTRAIARLARRADAVFYGGITANRAVPLWRALYRAKRSLRLFAGDGVAESRFVARIGGAARRTRILVSTLEPSAYPASGQEVIRALGNPDPYALYGYEAMALALDAITRGGGTRAGAVQAFFATKDRDSVLGRYSIDPNGDTTLTQYGRYRVERRRLVFDGVVDAAR
jgi:branched-chain amino acid transport system substrate-binding protein